MEPKKVNIPKKGAARRLAARLAMLRQQKPPQELVDAIIRADKETKVSPHSWITGWLTGATVLDCSEYTIASLLGGIPPATSRREQFITGLTPQTSARLVMLFAIVRQLGPLRPEVLIVILETPVFEDEDGLRYSVLSGLERDKYPLEILLQIADTARREYIEEWRRAPADVSDALCALLERR